MVKTLILLLVMGLSQQVFSQPFRVYCKPEGGVILENRADDGFTEGNVRYPLPHFVIEQGQIPAYEWIGQLRCAGQGLQVDSSWVPGWVLKERQRAQAQESLDQELAKESPDPVQVIRLQREIEKLKD